MIDPAKLPPRVAELVELLASNAGKIAAQDCRIEVDCAGGNLRMRVRPVAAPVVDVQRSLSRRT
jgi:hypothetical protein